MILASIKLRNFRIHENVELKFAENLNYIVGGNGQGKTTILESIYYMCTTKSFEAKSDGEVVRFGNEDFEIRGKFIDLTEDDVRVVYNKVETKKIYYLNEKQPRKSSDIIGKFPVVLLTPADHDITQGVPGQRRRFIDSVISQASNTYLKNLLDYNRTLKQRSSLLSKIKEYNSKELMNELDAWTDKLIETGTELIERRIKFIDEFEPYIRDSYFRIMNKEEQPGIDYYYLNGAKELNVKEHFTTLLKEKKEDELRRAANLVGPHKDDFLFKINDLNLKTYGSQGQHKTYQAVLRFAEFYYLRDTTSKTPIFLLDDVFGELDAARAHKISDYLKEVGQAFVTLTDFGNFSFLKKDEEDNLIKLNGGEVIYA
jgi:DNA replication and repair protein RecF